MSGRSFTVHAADVTTHRWGDGVLGLIINGTTCVAACPSPLEASVTVFLGQGDDQVLERVRTMRTALDEVERRVLARRPVVSEGAENGTAGTAPSTTPCDPQVADCIRPLIPGQPALCRELIGGAGGWTVGKVYTEWQGDRLLDDDGDSRPVLTYAPTRFTRVDYEPVACDPLPAPTEIVTAP